MSSKSDLMEMTCKLWTRIKGLDQDHQRKVSKLNWSSPSILKSRTAILFHLKLENRKGKSKMIVIPKSRTTILFQAKLDVEKRKSKSKVIPKSRTAMFQSKLNKIKRKVTASPKSKIINIWSKINICHHARTLIILNDYISSDLDFCHFFNSH